MKEDVEHRYKIAVNKAGIQELTKVIGEQIPVSDIKTKMPVGKNGFIEFSFLGTELDPITVNYKISRSLAECMDIDYAEIKKESVVLWSR